MIFIENEKIISLKKDYDSNEGIVGSTTYTLY